MLNIKEGLRGGCLHQGFFPVFASILPACCYERMAGSNAGSTSVDRLTTSGYSCLEDAAPCSPVTPRTKKTVLAKP